MPPPGVNRYYIALLPPAPLREQLHGMKLHLKEMVQSKAALSSPPHITLHMPFEWKEAKEEKLMAALKRFAEGREKFTVTLQDFSCFAPRVLFVAVNSSPQLLFLEKDLQGFCKRELNLFHARYRDLPFHPHITLAFRDLKKDSFEKAWAHYRDQLFSETFMADRIVLLRKEEAGWVPLSDFLF